MNEKYRRILGRPALSVKEAADVLGISERAAYRAIERGNLAVARLGRKIIVSSDAIRRVLGLPDED